MGLDMCLSRIPKNQSVEDTNYDNCKEVAYWRKFNALHKWFVDNCQNGIDECQYSEVTQEHLAKLQEIFQNLTNENCEELLPTQSGFFFGSTEYDHWYWNDVEETKNVLNQLKEFDWENEKLVYHSSW